jgi:hypothetical protein
MSLSVPQPQRSDHAPRGGQTRPAGCDVGAGRAEVRRVRPCARLACVAIELSRRASGVSPGADEQDREMTCGVSGERDTPDRLGTGLTVRLDL